MPLMASTGTTKSTEPDTRRDLVIPRTARRITRGQDWLGIASTLAPAARPSTQTPPGATTDSVSLFLRLGEHVAKRVGGCRGSADLQQQHVQHVVRPRGRMLAIQPPHLSRYRGVSPNRNYHPLGNELRV